MNQNIMETLAEMKPFEGEVIDIDIHELEELKTMPEL